jgi:hypothetical protein
MVKPKAIETDPFKKFGGKLDTVTKPSDSGPLTVDPFAEFGGYVHKKVWIN